MRPNGITVRIIPKGEKPERGLMIQCMLFKKMAAKTLHKEKCELCMARKVPTDPGPADESNRESARRVVLLEEYVALIE